MTHRTVCVIALIAAVLASSCGGQVGSPSAGAGGVAGVAGTGGGGAAGDAGGGTPCSAPDWEGCGIPECPERPGCTLCLPPKSDLITWCAEYVPEVPGVLAPDGQIILADQPSFGMVPLFLDPVPFSAGVIVANLGQAARLGYADRGKWTGEPIPQPTECPSLPGVSICGGYCGGCPVGEVCTGRAPLHPYGLCIRKDAGVCSLVPEVNGSKCAKGERCFVYTVEPEHQFAADATGFCMPEAECQATATSLPGGGKCE